MSNHENNCFITLTYNEKHLPNDYSLNHTHVQKFFKKLRKELDKINHPKIKYFMCGEYGDETWRPHYHIMLFGYDFPDKQQVQSLQVDQPYYISPFLQKLWDKGNHTITNASWETAAYVARYVTKKVTGDKAEDHYNRLIIDFNEVTGEMNYFNEVNLKPEYAAMSRGRKKGQAIGAAWYDKYKKDCFPSNYLIKDGRKIPVPKYYQKLLEREDTIMLDQVKQASKIRAIQLEQENTPYRLKQKEHCKIQQQKSIQRNKI